MLQKLKELGLTEYELKTYLTLLEYGPLTGGEVSKKSKVPQGKVYWALHKLAENNFVNVVGIKPQIFHALDAEIAINNLITQKIEELKEVKTFTIEELKKIITPIREKKVVEKIQVLSGEKSRYAINDHFFNEAKEEIRYIFTYEERPYSLMRNFADAIKRGIKVKLIATTLTEKSLKYIKEDMNSGVQVKYLNVEEIRLQIMDQKEARITVINPKDRRDRTTIYFQNSQMAKHLAAYFEVLWKKAAKID